MQFSNALKSLGPGLLFAGAAVGVSHLVQSTRAGATYGYELVWAVLLINLLKYPFFEIGQRYTTVMGESIIRGYSRLGDWAVKLYLALNIVLSVFTVAAITFVASAMFNFLFFNFTGNTLSNEATSVVYLGIVLVILNAGKYNLFESFVKYLTLSLSALTIISFIIALTTTGQHSTDFIPPEILNQAGIGFLLALMGWMPAPLELSSWTSMWSLENDKANNSKKSLSDSLFDFNVGYIVSVILAICFLGLGASVMYGSGDTISGKAVVFASQLLSLYTEVIGSWSKTIIAFIMFATMLSTVITCVDAYPRALAESLGIIRNTDSDKSKKKYLLVFQLFVAIVSSVLIVFFTQSLTLFVDLVTIISFISSPIVALLNFMIVRKSFFPVEHQPSKWLNYLSYIGIAFFFGFAALFLYSKLFMS